MRRDAWVGERSNALSPLARARLKPTDRDNARRLAAALGDRLLHAVGRGWAVWDGRRFDLDGGEDAARMACAGLPELIREDALLLELNHRRRSKRYEPEAAPSGEDAVWLDARLAASPEDDHDDWSDGHRAALLLQTADRCGNLAKINNAMKLLQGLLRTPSTELDARPELLNCADGTLDLDALAASGLARCADDPTAAMAALRPHDPSDRITRVARAAFDPTAEGPGWTRFLADVLPDPEMRDFVRRALGLAVFGRNDEQVALILRGEGGNGKSTLMNAVAHALGDHAAHCKIEILLETRTTSAGAPSPEEMSLPGARLIVCTEPDPDDRLSAKKLKAFTGGDPRPVRAPYGEREFTYTPSGVPVIMCNRFPRMKLDDHGSRRRIVPVPFEARLDRSGVRRNARELEAELRAERDAVLLWLIDGWLDWRRGGLRPPAAAEALKRRIVDLGDPVGRFLLERCRRAPGSRVRRSDVHAAFLRWAEEVGEDALEPKALIRVMGEKGVEGGKSNGVMIWKDLTLVAAGAETDDRDAPG